MSSGFCVSTFKEHEAAVTAVKYINYSIQIFEPNDPIFMWIGWAGPCVWCEQISHVSTIQAWHPVPTTHSGNWWVRRHYLRFFLRSLWSILMECQNSQPAPNNKRSWGTRWVYRHGGGIPSNWLLGPIPPATSSLLSQVKHRNPRPQLPNHSLGNPPLQQRSSSLHRQGLNLHLAHRGSRIVRHHKCIARGRPELLQQNDQKQRTKQTLLKNSVLQ